MKSKPSKLVTYPSYGFQTEQGDWRVNVSGLAYQTPPFTLRQRMLLKMLGNAMKASEEDLECQTFQNRVWPFFVEADKGMHINVHLGKQSVRLKRKTRRNGQFYGWPRFSDSLIQSTIESDESGRLSLKYCVSTDHPQSELVPGVVRLLPPTGLSVISDIDDTIKETTVTNRRELLQNTFLRDFKYVEGMADVYQNWHRAGAEFHYVSSSPWQLFESLSRLQADGGFPMGTMHLRNFRLRDQLFKKVLIIRRKGKASEIKRLLKNLPNRKFILVGDSGEKDPEIYRKILVRFPSQIEGVFIREVINRPLAKERVRKLNKHAGNGVWAAFSTPEMLEKRAEDIISQLETLVKL